MSVSFHRMGCFISLVMLSACRSDADKLQRLEGDKAIACLSAEKYRREFELAKAPKAPAFPKADSLLLRYMDFNAKCELAQRDLNRFMR